MSNELHDALMMGIIIVLGPLLFVAIISFVFQKFIALKQRPNPRAAWTAGLSYLVVSLFFVFSGFGGFEIWAFAAAIPGGLVAYWFWRREFSRAWIEDADEIPDGINLANDDWRIGLVVVLLAIAAAAVKSLIKQS
jgi:hypothetical protein